MSSIPGGDRRKVWGVFMNKNPMVSIQKSVDQNSLISADNGDCLDKLLKAILSLSL